jgi:peptidoglycan/LPS O-acetylase OafA/YrhL
MQALSTPDYRPDIDGLRAVAVAAVVLGHAFPSLAPGGFIGVDVFFVISGFLISSVILRSRDRGRFSALAFYQGRVRRIFPSLILVLLACLVFGWYSLWFEEFRQLCKHTFSASAFVSNVALWREAGYFDTASEQKPLLHLWSLGVEEQFYLLWPLVLVLTFSRRMWCGATLSVAIAGSFLWNVLWTFTSPTSAFYLLQCRLWELAAGGLLAVVSLQAQLPGGPRLRQWGAAAGLALLGIATWLLSPAAFPGWWALLPTVGTLLLIAAGPEAAVNRVLSLRPVVFVGLISYPLYLWHWPMLAFARIIAGGTPALGVRVVMIVASPLLAWLTYRMIEMPIRRSRHPAIVLALVAVMGVTGLFGLAVYRGDLGRAGKAPLPYEDDFVTFGAFVAGFRPCTGPETSERCVQAGDGRVDAAIVGDSHADQLFPGIAQLDARRNWSLMSTASCPPAIGTSSLRGTPARCIDRNERVTAALVDHPSIRVVVLTFSFGYPTADLESIIDGVGHTVSVLLRGGKEVVLYQDIPVLPFQPADQVPRPFRPRDVPSVVPRQAALDLQPPYRAAFVRLQMRYPAIQIFDPVPSLCDASTCTAYRQGHSLYFDSNHLSIAGSAYVAGSFMSWLNANIGSR